MISDRDIERAAAPIDRQHGLVALYLFGSQASGRARPDSDVDVAVMVERLPTALQRVQLREDMSERLGRAVDLVFLDDASPILVRQVLRHGRLLVDRQPRRRAELVVRTLTDYADLERVRAAAERRLVERVDHAR